MSTCNKASQKEKHLVNLCFSRFHFLCVQQLNEAEAGESLIIVAGIVKKGSHSSDDHIDHNLMVPTKSSVKFPTKIASLFEMLRGYSHGCVLAHQMGHQLHKEGTREEGSCDMWMKETAHHFTIISCLGVLGFLPVRLAFGQLW